MKIERKKNFKIFYCTRRSILFNFEIIDILTRTYMSPLKKFSTLKRCWNTAIVIPFSRTILLRNIFNFIINLIFTVYYSWFLNHQSIVYLTIEYYCLKKCFFCSYQNFQKLESNTLCNCFFFKKTEGQQNFINLMLIYIFLCLIK